MEQENKKELGIRVRLPFCRKKNALYGDDFLEGMSFRQKKAYSEAVCKEIQAIADDAQGYTITQLYLGDGPVNQAETTSWQLILRECKKNFDLKNAERFFLASPDQFSPDDYYRYITEGGGWLLIDMVSHVDEELKAVGVSHTARDNALMNITLSDFGCRTFDLRLYYNLPGQTEETMVKSVDRAIRMYGNHISLLPWPEKVSAVGEEAGLKVGTEEEKDAEKKAAAEGEKNAEGKETEPAENPLYLAGKRILLEKGFQEYMTGRFTRTGKRIHLYEKPAPEWMGIGLGASSCMDGMRFANTSNWDLYLANSDDFEKICYRTE